MTASAAWRTWAGSPGWAPGSRSGRHWRSVWMWKTTSFRRASRTMRAEPRPHRSSRTISRSQPGSRSRSAGRVRRGLSRRRRQLPQHVLENPAVPVVLQLLRRIDPYQRAQLDARPVGASRRDGQLLAAREPLGEQGGETGQIEGFFPGEPERLRGLARQELQRQNAHAYEVRAVNALVALRDHGPHAE